MTKYVFWAKVYADVWVTAETEVDARQILKDRLRLTGLPFGDVEQEPIEDRDLILGEDQPEQG